MTRQTFGLVQIFARLFYDLLLYYLANYKFLFYRLNFLSPSSLFSQLDRLHLRFWQSVHKHADKADLELNLYSYADPAHLTIKLRYLSGYEPLLRLNQWC